jgi:hypothetical protein
MQTPYDWDLVERLLHEAQNAEDDSFKPRQYAQDHAMASAAVGEPVANLEQLKADAAQYEQLLSQRGFIAPRQDEQGSYTLTPRGASLLALIDSSIPGNDHPREVLDDQADALDPETFDEVAAKAQIA